MLTDSLSEVFGRTKLHKKGSRNIYYFLLKKVIAILRLVSSDKDFFVCCTLLNPNLKKKIKDIYPLGSSIKYIESICHSLFMVLKYSYLFHRFSYFYTLVFIEHSSSSYHDKTVTN